MLTGQQKTGEGLMTSQLQSLQNPRKLAELGVGFVPFGNVGLFAFNALTKDGVSSVGAAAARALAKEPDPQTTMALVQAASDNSWMVREGALEAIAKRAAPALLKNIQGAMSDDPWSSRLIAANHALGGCQPRLWPYYSAPLPMIISGRKTVGGQAALYASWCQL